MSDQRSEPVQHPKKTRFNQESQMSVCHRSLWNSSSSASKMTASLKTHQQVFVCFVNPSQLFYEKYLFTFRLWS